MKAKISLITLGVENFETSLKFYRDGLGFITHDFKEGDDMVFFTMEGTWLALYPKEKLAADARIPALGSGFHGFTLAHNVASKDMVNEVFEVAIKAGAKSIKKPNDTLWGGYSGYFSDPDGYLWEVAFNPFTDLT